MISYYSKYQSHYDECKSACENESACTGFSISNSTHAAPNLCVVHGNVSSFNAEYWANSDAWIVKDRLTYGFKGFEVHSSKNNPGVRCFKRQYQDYLNIGEFSDLIWSSEY